MPEKDEYALQVSDDDEDERSRGMEFEIVFLGSKPNDKGPVPSVFVVKQHVTNFEEHVIAREFVELSHSGREDLSPPSRASR